MLAGLGTTCLAQIEVQGRRTGGRAGQRGDQRFDFESQWRSRGLACAARRTEQVERASAATCKRRRQRIEPQQRRAAIVKAQGCS